MTKILRFCNHRSNTRLATSQLTLRSVPLLLVRWEWQWIMVLSSTNTYTCIVLVHEIMKTFLERYLARRESGDQVEQISTPSVFFWIRVYPSMFLYIVSIILARLITWTSNWDGIQVQVRYSGIILFHAFSTVSVPHHLAFFFLCCLILFHVAS